VDTQKDGHGHRLRKLSRLWGKRWSRL